MKSPSRRSFLQVTGTVLADATLTRLLSAARASEAVEGQVTSVAASGIGPYSSTLRIIPPSGSKAEIFLSPDSLSMPGPRIAFRGRDLRLFSLRGSTSFRPRTVTGLKAMVYPPLNLSDPQVTPPLGLFESGSFNLSFREHHTGTLIQDIQDEFGDPLYLNQKLDSADQLGPTYTKSKSSSILLTQDAQWWPHCYVRTGVFNRRLAGRLISFGVECRVFLSDVADEIYEEIDLTNRSEEVLSLTVIPDQPRQDQRQPRFVRDEGDFVLEAVSDLGTAGPEGWALEVPPRSVRTFRVALLMKPAGQPRNPGFHASDLRQRVEASVTSHLKQLEWASSKLPHLQTANSALDEFYRRSILSVLCCRRVRDNFCVQPFYDLGFSRGAATSWDTAFSSRLIAQFDPQGLIGMVKAFLRSGGALNSTYLEWTGISRGWYAQSPFSLMQMINDYITMSGDAGCIDAKAGEFSLFEHLKGAGKEFLTHYLQADGLIDIGGGTGKMLEIRTLGYEHGVATINALAVDYFHQLSDWCTHRQDADAPIFAAAATKTQLALNRLLWNETTGWYSNLYPDGTLSNVFSYHLFDMLGSSAVPIDRKRRIAQHIREGEFLAPYGMYSIALTDREHWDMEDLDWGGGGQYVGQPLKTAEALYDLGEADKAWQILSRCTQWVERFPYFPQTIYGDDLSLQEHQIDWPLQISSGAGAQAIIAGIFGIKPQIDGSIKIEPHYNSTLGSSATLSNYLFRGHAYAVNLMPTGFTVLRDGKRHAKGKYQETVTISPTA